MTWPELEKFAPYTKASLDCLKDQVSAPVLDAIPDFLLIEDHRVDPLTWAIELDRVDFESGVSNREVLLRYLLSRAIVDQGSDIAGVEKWHSVLLGECYKSGFRILHAPDDFVNNYQRILEIASETRDNVVASRAAPWAAGGKNRKVGQYTPFNVDGQRGGIQAHWFLSARLFPALLLSVAHAGGLVDLVFSKMSTESPIEMSRRLRQDRVIGLGYCIGDKACDLFTKWTLGSYRLTAGLLNSWAPADSPIPMDQRIGRLMTRFGLMDEFFGVTRMMSSTRFGFTPDDAQPRPSALGSSIPVGRWFLRVMDFRRKAKVEAAAPKLWLENEWRRFGGSGRPPKFGPQDVVTILCKSLSEYSGVDVTPVEIDDQLMRLGGSVCKDDLPECNDCSLSSSCQANSPRGSIALKSCYT